MNSESLILFITAASIAFFHTLLGPDHYIPFIAMAKAGRWSRKKTFFITAVSGLGHIFSSVLIGIFGFAAGAALDSLNLIEAFRADLAAWLFISAGLLYFAWGIKWAYRKKTHHHKHEHDLPADGKITPWVIFTIFVLGPCEPLIPVLIYPSVLESILTFIIVITIFTVITISTMITVVAAGLLGADFLPFKNFQRYSHAVGGLLLLFCGLSIKFLGL